MGLNYLQKKNWHPGSLKNQEIVWIREQLQAEIIKREQERAKKLAEEKNIEELKRIQAEAGLIPKSHLDRMEWMYDVGKLEQKEKSAEEYLTGKPISQEEAVKLAESRNKTKQFEQGNDSQYQTVFKEEITNTKCEDFVKVHEDPLFNIMKGEMDQKQRILANPLRMKELLEQSLAQKKIKKEKKEKKDKKEKKEKKHKKEKKSKKNKNEQQNSDGDSTGTTNSIYSQYIKDRLGNLAVTDENGQLKVDFGMMKRKYRNNLQTESNLEELRKQMANEGKERINKKQQVNKESIENKYKTGHFLHEMRKEIYNQDTNDAFYDRLNRNRNFQERFLE